jgi:hypothetical protein
MASVTLSWDGLTASSHAAFECAFGARVKLAYESADANESIATREPFVSTSTLLFGIARTHQGAGKDNPLLDLLAHHGRSADDLYAALRSRMEGHAPFDLNSEPVPLGDFPELTDNVLATLEAASKLATEVPNPPSKLPLRFLFGGLLMTRRSRAFETLAMSLGPGVNLPDIADNYGSFLARGPTLRFADHLREVFPRPAPSWFAGFTADSVTGVDLLNRVSLVDQLARWLSAKSLQTPLAIGLFGDWGSGKSFFMRQLMDHINALTSEAASVSNPRGTSYCPHIAQVNFNAWFHSDGEIWPSLAAQVFRAVSGERTDVPTDEASLQELRAFWTKQNPSYRDAAERRGAALEEEDEAREDEARLTDEAVKKRGEIAQGVQRALGDGERAERAKNAVEAGKALTEVVKRRTVLLSWWKRLHVGWKVGLVGAMVALVIGAIALLVRPSLLAAVTTVLGVAGGTIAAISGGLARVVSSVMASFKAERQARDLERQATGARARIQQAASARADAEADLGRLAQLGLTSAYALGQAEIWAQREHLGTVSEIRRSFELLSQIIDRSGEQRVTGSTSSVFHEVPIDRIVVYIDDLDRCQPDLVVRVLEAVKLLMDLPNFVVIIGVDSRWLFRSLEIRFHELVSAEGQPAEEGAEEWAATPQNYLEKIFQFSLRLPPMTREGYSSLIRGMFSEPKAAVTSAPGPRVPSTGKEEVLPIALSQHGAGSARTETVYGDGGGQRRSREGMGGDQISMDLVLEPQELRMLESLAPLIETPRSAKRLTNVYRLLRVIVGKDTLLEGDAFACVMVLLGIVVGFPRQSGLVFRSLMTETPETKWDSFVDLLRPDPKTGRNRLVGDIPEVDLASWSRMHHELVNLGPTLGPDRRCGSLREWAGIVGDFTFHPWRNPDVEAHPDGNSVRHNIP